MKNNRIYLLVAAVLILGVIFMVNRNDKDTSVQDVASSISPSPSLDSTSIPTPVKTPELSKKTTPKPTGGLIAQEVKGYQYWKETLDPFNRYLAIDENCTAIVPSQVVYPNNSQIMLDNTLSNRSRVLTIGDSEYPIDAKSWTVVTLSSAKLPAKLTMFCGAMELGQIDLQ